MFHKFFSKYANTNISVSSASPIYHWFNYHLSLIQLLPTSYLLTCTKGIPYISSTSYLLHYSNDHFCFNNDYVTHKEVWQICRRFLYPSVKSAFLKLLSLIVNITYINAFCQFWLPCWVRNIFILLYSAVLQFQRA